MDDKARTVARKKIAQYELTLRKKQYRKGLNFVAKEFQKMIRLEAADCHGVVQCVTCEWSGHWKECHGGHFISRSRTATMFDERNCHPQCVTCNYFGAGVQARYYEYMVATYGEDVVEELKAKSREAVKFDMNTLAIMKLEYKTRIQQACKRISLV